MSEAVNMFEQALRMKLRFANKGMMNVEDLWDLSLADLNNIAKGLHNELKDQNEVSFIEEKPSIVTKLQLMFDVVIHIINVKKDEAKAAKVAVEERSRKLEMKQELLELKRQKQKEQYSGLSLEEIDKQLAELSN